jgi:hypothetical protein
MYVHGNYLSYSIRQLHLGLPPSKVYALFDEDYMTAGTHDRAFTSAPVTELFYMKAR